MILFELHQKGEPLTSEQVREHLYTLGRDPRFHAMVALIERLRDQASVAACSEMVANQPGRLAFLTGKATGLRELLSALAGAINDDPPAPVGPVEDEV